MDEVKRRLLAASFELQCCEVLIGWLKGRLLAVPVEELDAFEVQRDVHAALSEAVTKVAQAKKLAADELDQTVEDRRRALGALMGDKPTIVSKIVDEK